MGFRQRLSSAPRAVWERFHLADSEVTLAHALKQMGMDTSGLSLTRLFLTTEFGELFWKMRAVGEDWRTRMAKLLYEADQLYGIIPDPRGHIPYSPHRFIVEIAHSEHIQLLHMTEEVRAYCEWQTQGQQLVYACMQTFPVDPGNARRPEIYLDEDPPPGVTWEDQINRATWQAAQVLGHYFLTQGLFQGGMAPEAVILPPSPSREKAMTALCHQFAKAFLGLKPRCADTSPCKCNEILWRAAQVPARHPEMTGTLALDAPRPHVTHTPVPEPTYRRTSKPTLRNMQEPRAHPPQQPPRNHPSFPSEPGRDSDPQITASRGGKPRSDLDDTQRLDH